MTREWKPGDVADLSYRYASGGRAIRVKGDFCPKEHPRVDHWHFGAGTHGDGSGSHLIRPLVVIDPEDREQVERLADMFFSSLYPEMANTAGMDDVNAMQAALREFANPTPPKPDEPMGLGAVVATENDGDYIHVSLEHVRPWLNVQTRRSVRWDDVAAVRILSEGVQL